jgi:hypothetical protein
MISLQPRETFAIVRQLADHTDLTTYYTQAVIRNSVTSEILATVNLTDKGSGRFLKIWEVPSDVSGMGFFIDITLSVYSDSGYTTKASTYGDELEEYLVFDRIVKSSGGGGVDVDYKKIEKLLTAAIKSIPEAKMESLGPVKTMLEDLKKGIMGIKIPMPEKMDHSPVLKAIDNSLSSVLKAIDNKEVTPETEMAPIIKIVEDKIDEQKMDFAKVEDKVAGVKKTLDEHVQEHRDEQSAEGKVAKITQSLSEILGSDITSPKNAKKNLENRVKSLL